MPNITETAVGQGKKEIGNMLTRRSTGFHFFVLLVLTVGINYAFAAEGVVGATCWATPVCPDCKGSQNTCRTVEETFYPGVLMAVAKDAVIKECQDRNALDYCGDGCSPSKREAVLAAHHGGCYEQCETTAHCLYGDNR